MRSPRVFFISDLHLTPERPLPVALLHRFLRERAPQADTLYILGDFFEAWVGDDDLAQPFHRDIAAELKSLSERGTSIFFLPGNRDFLVGPAFAEAAGLHPLEDPSEHEICGVPTLLTHGDLFCTDDAAYQDFRREVRTSAWQQQFLAQPLAQRHALAKALRERSELAKSDKKPEIMDVNNAEIERMLVAHPVKRIIHGHTHRPARHEYRLNGQICERWVLPDWYDSGGYLDCDENGCRLSAFS